MSALEIVQGGLGVDFDTEARDAWERIAAVCEDELSTLHALSPHRQPLTAAWAAACRAAGGSIRPACRHLASLDANREG